MKLVALEIPADAHSLANWLEEQIVGMDLGDLVAQLMVGSANQDAASLEDLLGDRLAETLASGLSACSEEQLRSLLAHPPILLELQERVFVEGGDHWRNVALSIDHQSVAKRVQEKSMPAVAEPVNLGTREQTSGRRFALYAVAASLLLGFGLWATSGPSPSGWGFDRPGMLTQNMSAPAYLEMLAEATGDWFKKRPADSQQLTKRLQGFRAGCDTLLAAAHPQLAAEDKQWLLQRCKAWRDEIDGYLANLTADQDAFADTSQAADSMIQRMAKALRERARLVAGAVG